MAFANDTIIKNEMALQSYLIAGAQSTRVTAI